MLRCAGLPMNKGNGRLREIRAGATGRDATWTLLRLWQQHPLLQLLVVPDDRSTFRDERAGRSMQADSRAA
jgi:hypothetical protein